MDERRHSAKLHVDEVDEVGEVDPNGAEFVASALSLVGFGETGAESLACT